MSGITRTELRFVPEETEADEAAPLEYDIAVFPADFTLEVLYQKWKNREILLPKFQRSFVWSREQSSMLIDSFMMGLPIPPIFLHVLPNQKYNVIDGRQRLESVFYFFEGFFGEPNASGQRRIFSLTGINNKSRWFNKTFDQLVEDDQRKLKNSVLRAMIIRQLKPMDHDTSIFYIFERLNTGGTSLLDQEVRNVIYQGTFNDLLKELNTDPNWRKIVGRPKVDSRQKDVQLILRYIALYHEGCNYEKPMKEFLSKFMSKHRNPPDTFIRDERERFHRTCDSIIQNLGERPFNPRGALNASIFDGIFTAFAKNERIPTDIAQRYTSLKAMNEFFELTSKATSDTDTVRQRLQAAQRVLFE